MGELEQVILAYVAAWNEAEESKRRELLERSWAEKGSYIDPTTHLIGREALNQHLGRLIEQFSDHRVLLSSGVDQHHGLIRFTWTRRRSDGSNVRSGVDFGELDEDGRLFRIIGFFDPPDHLPSSWPGELVWQGD